jgi:hypothetical protein
MGEFERGDGVRVRVVDGFRRATKNHRPTVTPRADWDEEGYRASAGKKVGRFGRLLAEIGRARPDLCGSEVLEVGCGDAMNSLLLALRPGVRRVLGSTCSRRCWTRASAGSGRGGWRGRRWRRRA